MSRWDKVVVIGCLLFALVVAPALVYFNWEDSEIDQGLGSDFQVGYEVGMHQARLYNSTTGEWPSYGWRHEHYKDDLQTEQDIRDTLDRPTENLSSQRRYPPIEIPGTWVNDTWYLPSEEIVIPEYLW